MALTEEDAEHLRLLSIFHFILAGLGALCSLFPVIHLVMGMALIGGDLEGFSPRGPRAEEMGRTMGWFFVAAASAMIVGGLTVSALLAWSGRCLQRRRRRTFCLVMAGLSCLSIPLGTVLGVFTILVLCRPGVKAEFAGG
jgi:hypothetical protein